MSFYTIARVTIECDPQTPSAPPKASLKARAEGDVMIELLGWISIPLADPQRLIVHYVFNTHSFAESNQRAPMLVSLI